MNPKKKKILCVIIKQSTLKKPKDYNSLRLLWNSFESKRYLICEEVVLVREKY